MDTTTVKCTTQLDQALCERCGKRPSDVTRDFSAFELEDNIRLCDWCDESLIEGGTRNQLADGIKARRASRSFVEVFVSETGIAFAYFSETPVRDGEVCWSTLSSESALDGHWAVWKPLAVQGFNGNALEHRITLEDPTNGDEIVLIRKHDVVECDGLTYRRAQSPKWYRAAVAPLPKVRKPEYVLSGLDEDRQFFIYVSWNKYGEVHPIRFFMGLGGKSMKNVPLTEFRRLRDGGSTYILTAEGTLHMPAWSEQGTWITDDEKKRTLVAKLSPDDFDIVEAEDGSSATLRLKKRFETTEVGA